MTTDEMIEVMARAIYGEDDLSGLGSDVRERMCRTARAALAAILQVLREVAADEATTTRTTDDHGKHCNCVTCELNATEDAIRARFNDIAKKLEC